jgi:hypothetical protein
MAPGVSDSFLWGTGGKFKGERCRAEIMWHSSKDLSGMVIGYLCKRGCAVHCGKTWRVPTVNTRRQLSPGYTDRWRLHRSAHEERPERILVPALATSVTNNHGRMLGVMGWPASQTRWRDCKSGWWLHFGTSATNAHSESQKSYLKQH